ncbi:hypothetical protein [Piscinibacter sp.]|uniref:hypothetical protein n=1 Tax=Piscinibacter sp. TaxID=1903157 RepID=UPI0035595CBE
MTGAIGFAAMGAVAEADTSEIHIYQQRTADGRVVLTDRPNADAATERTWQIRSEDPGAALQRREQVRREAQAVSQRIQWQLEREQEREHELALARTRLAEAEARVAAERTRAQAAPETVVLLGARIPHPRLPRFPRPWPPRPRLAPPPSLPMPPPAPG